ncbi:RidA family protein [Rugosimonospora acidiphila]|uniref:RidA family protein n=1 Tax=Rugosimonospora acidiphila TaxID=556531 RepID=A0ABP9RKP4_9ACTN
MATITPISAENAAPFTLNGVPVHGSQAVLVDCGTHRLLYTSGQVAPAGPDGRGDIETQVRQVLDRVRGLVEAAGGQLTDVAKLMAWAPRREDVAVYASVRKEYFSHAPASTTVISELVEPDILIEVEAIAVISPAR